MTSKSDSISDIHSNNIDFINRVIFLQEKDDTEVSSGIDFRMAQNFIKNINILIKSNPSEPITICLQTIGGCWYSGISIYDIIKSCSCDITIIGYGQICSMGTIIMQAADNRLLFPNTTFMIHYGSSDNSGDYLSSQNYAKIEKINMECMVDIYSGKCVNGEWFKKRDYSIDKTKSYLKTKMKNGDWYMTSQEAIKYGFIDKIIDKFPSRK
jgi:ATP-dependent Clp protease protease subunit